MKLYCAGDRGVRLTEFHFTESSLSKAWSCVNNEASNFRRTELETYGATLQKEAAEDRGVRRKG